MITINETSDSGYSTRTKINAKVADLTIAFAVDFTTSGERLTKKFAGKNYFAFDMTKDSEKQLFDLKRLVYENCPSIINIAGNGIYTFDKHGFSQSYVDGFIYAILYKLYSIHNFVIVSGCQTGADLAGARAGYLLGADVQVTLPKGYRQRDKFGNEVYNTKDQIYNQITLH